MNRTSGINILADCTLCPRNCRADRIKAGTGYCGMDAGLNVASVCIHRGEEPVIGGEQGICNVFFAGCNLHCVYCQNHDISQPCSNHGMFESNTEIVLGKIISILETGINSVGFVSPSHMVPQMLKIIFAIHEKGFHPVIVYNTNSYDKTETLRSLEGMVDIWLPDFKYVSTDLAYHYSEARNYPEIALKAIKEMYYQVGSTLHTDERGKAHRGMLIRHLILPGYADESKKVLDTIATELSTGVNVSLMSQYHPMHKADGFPPLNRVLYNTEYEEVVRHMHMLGFRNGWIQDPESRGNYLPDFSKEHPFE